MPVYKIIDQFWIDEDLHIRAILTSASKKWYLQYNAPGSGKGRQCRKSLKTTSKKEARLRGYAFAREFEGGNIPIKKKNRVTLGEVIVLQMLRLKDRNRDPVTFRLYSRFFDILAAYMPRGMNTPMTDLKLLTLESFARELREKGIDTPADAVRNIPARKGRPLASKTVREVMKAIRGLIRFARERELLDKDPAPGYELPEDNTAEIEVFSPSELERLFADPRPGMADIWKFMTHTALRIHEFCWLQKADVNFDDKGRPVSIHIRKKTCPDTGKPWHPKHHVERVVSLTEEAKDILLRSMAASTGVWAFECPPGPRLKTRRWHSGRLRNWFNKRLTEAGILHGHPHAMRHTFASFLANIVVMAPSLLQRFLGHEDLKSTMQYLHAKAEDVGDALGKGDYTKLAHTSGSFALTGNTQEIPASAAQAKKDTANVPVPAPDYQRVSSTGGEKSPPVRKAG